MSSDNETKGALGASYTVDMLGPAVGINVPGPTGVPGRDPNTGWLLFDKDSTEKLFMQYQLPHGAIEGDSFGLHFHIHWHKSTSAAGNVAWQMRYRYGNINTVWAAWSDPEIVTVPETGMNDTAEHQMLTAFTPIVIANSRISMGLLVELARVGGDDLDTYGADAVLSDADCHVRINQPGSVQTYLKYRNELLDYT